MTGVSKAVARLRMDDSGQVLMFVVILMLALLLFMLTIPNVTYVTTAKMRAQTSADVGAYTAAIWLARGLNVIAVLNTGIALMHIWRVVLTAVLAMASALTATKDQTSRAMASTICQTFFGPSVYGYADAKDEYAQALQALDKSADDLADMRSDVAAQFPAIAFYLGTHMASADLGSGSATTSRGGVAFTTPSFDRIELVPTSTADLTPRLKAVSGTLEKGISVAGGTSINGGIDIGTSDLNVKAQYGVKYEVDGSVVQKFRYIDRYITVEQRYLHWEIVGYDKTGKPIRGWVPLKKQPRGTFDMTNPKQAQECDRRLHPKVYDDYWRHPSDYKLKGQPLVVHKENGDTTFTWKYDDWEEMPAEKQAAVRDSFQYELAPWFPLPIAVAKGYTAKGWKLYWSDLDNKMDGKSGLLVASGPDEGALPARVKWSDPHILGLAWRVNPANAPGLRPVMAGRLFGKHAVPSQLPLVAVSQARAYFDGAASTDPLLNPAWDAALVSLAEEDVAAIQAQVLKANGQNIGQPQAPFKFPQLFKSSILMH